MREQSIFIQAMEKADPAERAAFLDQACADDPALRPRIERLLERHGQSGDLFDRPSSWFQVTGEHENAEELGTHIGPYKLMEQIGEGGMGVVYVAEQVEPVRRKVALKIIKPGMDTKQVIARFEAERQALAMMDHPNIARVHDAGSTAAGRPYFVMELVRGVPITEYCDREWLSISERLELFVQVCRAVQHAHQKGIIHRDLKPSNILVTVIDGEAVPKVIDFGIAKATGQSLTDRTIYTAFHQFIGTPLYMSPEQADLSGMDIDTRGDIYSLGVLLYELLTGTTPFDQETFRKAAFDEVRRIIREQEPQTPSTRLSGLGATLRTVSARRKADPRRLGTSMKGELDWIVMKALEKDRRRRYETANDFASDITRFLTDQPVQACPPSAVYRLRKFVRRNKGPVAAGLALAGLLVLGTVGTTIGLMRALRAERDATREKQRATAAEASAKAEADAAEAVVAFLEDDLLAQANPEMNPRDKQVTVDELLGRAAARLGDRFAQRPEIEARIRLTIGQSYVALGNFTAAQPHLERAWEIGRTILGENHRLSLKIVRELASLYEEQGRGAEAIALLSPALVISQRVLGKEDPETMKFQNVLAVAYMHRKQLDDARPLFVEAMEVSRRVLGDENETTLSIMNNLASLYFEQQEPDKAEPLFVDVLKNSRRVLGDDHPGTLSAMNNLAGYYWSTQKLDRSIPLFEEAWKRLQKRLGPDHPGTLSTLANLGVNYHGAGRKSEAIERLKEAWSKARGLPDPLIRNLSWIPRTLGFVLEESDQFKEAETTYREMIEVARQKHGDSTDDLSEFQWSLARNLCNQKKYTEAVQLLRDCLRYRERNEADYWRTYHTKFRLGDCLACDKKHAEAEPLLLAGYEGMKRQESQIAPKDRTILTEAVEELAQFYEGWGKPEKAAEWRAKRSMSKATKPDATKKH